jgi:hypothetical protein
MARAVAARAIFFVLMGGRPLRVQAVEERFSPAL